MTTIRLSRKVLSKIYAPTPHYLESSHRDPFAKYLFERGYLPGKCLCVRGIGGSWKIVGVRGLDRASWKMSICSMRK